MGGRVQSLKCPCPVPQGGRVQGASGLSEELGSPASPPLVPSLLWDLGSVTEVPALPALLQRVMTKCFFNGAACQHGAAPGPEASLVLVLVASWAARPEQRHPPHQEGILLPELTCPAASSRGRHECPGASGTNDHKLEGLKLQTFILSRLEDRKSVV